MEEVFETFSGWILRNDRKLLFFDVDGTLIDEKGFIPDSATAAIRKARESGNLCYINTGRPYSHIAPEVKEIGFDGYVCGCGQHIIIDGKEIRFARISAECCGYIVEKVREYHMDTVYEGEAGFWAEFEEIPEFYRQEQKRFASYGLKTCLTGPVDGELFEKFCCWINPGSRFEEFRASVSAYFTPIDRDAGMYEFVQNGYSKEKGLRTVLEETGVGLGNCYAFGDSPNDLPMLSYIPHSIVMGNAMDYVKQAAEFVTEDMYHDGIEKAVEHYRLNQ